MKNETVTLQHACDSFNLGTFVKSEIIDEGVLNLNYKLHTDQGAYFVKVIRAKKQDSILLINKIESFMKEQSIPAIAMLMSKGNTPFAVIENQLFTVYPFIESDRTHTYSTEDYFKMGQMLAWIHLVTKDFIPDDLELKPVKNNDIDKTIEILSSYKETIISKDFQDPTDELFLKYINLKLQILESMQDSTEIYTHQLHILHGDYHAGNLLIDKDSREIIGICDWEKTEKGSRAYEIIRSAILLFENIPKEMEQFKSYIQGYMSIYPISKQELNEGLIFRIKSLVKSKWIEDLYYNNNDSRANKFIQIDIDRMNFFVPMIKDEKQTDFFDFLLK